LNTLEIDSVHLNLGGKTVLSNIYLKCKTGDIIGILGRNGCGKSSLLKVLFGSLKADNKSVRLNQSYLKQLYTRKEAVNFSPQEGMLMKYLTFKEVVRIFELENHLDQILSIDEIKHNQESEIGQLSGGIKKMIEIMTMLYSKSKFTLLDEPFSFLSPVLIEKLLPHIKSQSKSKGIILTDHQYETVWETANKHYILYEGTLRQISKPQELEEYGYINSIR